MLARPQAGVFDCQFLGQVFVVAIKEVTAQINPDVLQRLEQGDLTDVVQELKGWFLAKHGGQETVEVATLYGCPGHAVVVVLRGGGVGHAICPDFAT